VSFLAQGIRNHIHFVAVIVNLKIIVLDQLQPSSLLYVQIGLSEKVLQALVVSEDMNHIPKRITPPGTQGMNHNNQFKIMSGIVLFMRAQLMRGVCNHMTFLHEDIAKPSARCITVNIEGLAMFGCANTGDVVNNFFKVSNTSSHSAFQTNFSSFIKRLVMGLEILEKFGITQR
jgi:hypothetical protein